jgi:hypothetical protein
VLILSSILRVPGSLSLESCDSGVKVNILLQLAWKITLSPNFYTTSWPGA